jgi:antitoxin component of MazEF toxin-antitoxin module
MSGVSIDPDAQTVTATRSLRSAGSSQTLTIPPAILDAVRAEEGDELQLVAHMDTGVIEVSKVEDGEEG